MTDKERVLRRLRAGHDVSPLDFDATSDAVVDGGKPIKRVAARINELRDDGHRIDTVGRRNRCALYRLIRDADMRDADVRITVDEIGQTRIAA